MNCIAYQAPLSMEFFRQEHWSGLPFPSPGDLPDPGIEPRSPALQADSLPSEPLTLFFFTLWYCFPLVFKWEVNLSVIKNNPLLPYCLNIDIPCFSSLFFIQQFVGQESSVANDTLRRSLPTNNRGVKVLRVTSRKNKESKGFIYWTSWIYNINKTN